MGSAKAFTPVEMVKQGAASAEVVAYLWNAVETGHSLMVSGRRGTGRTSTLNAVAAFVRPDARIASVERRSELVLPHTNWSSHAAADDAAGADVQSFVQMSEALQKRADCLIVGDLRAQEAFPAFAASMAGISTLSTFEADSVRDLVNRLEDPPFSIPRIVLTSLHAILLQSRDDPAGPARTASVVELVGYNPETNELITNTVFEWEPGTGQFQYKGHSFLYDETAERRKVDEEAVQRDMERRVDLVRDLVRRDADAAEIHEVVSSYYRDPVGTWKRVRGDPPPRREDFPPVNRIR